MESSTSSRVSQSHQSSTSSVPQQASKSRVIAVVGSINSDYILRVSQMPRISETVLATWDVIPGGKGAMQAVACYKLLRTESNAATRLRRRSVVIDDTGSVDITVELHARVGADQTGKVIDKAGKEMLKVLQGIGLATKHIRVVPGADTGLAFVTVNAETGENYVVLCAGANRSADFPIPFPQGDIDLFIFQLEIEPETVWSHVRMARDSGAQVLLNAAPATEKIPDDIWHNLNHLIMNRVEAETLVATYCDESVAFDDKRDLSRSESVERYQRFCKLFLNKRVQNVVITLGEYGCVAGSIMENGKDLIIEQEVRKVEQIADRTGAGGVFIAAYAIDYIRQTAAGKAFAIKHAIEWACNAARLSVREEGSIDGIPTGDMVERELSAN